MGVFGQIRKRDDRIVPFDPRKLVNALYRALSSRPLSDRRESARQSGSAAAETSTAAGQGAASRLEESGGNDNAAADRALARELGAAVVHFAYERFGERIPSTVAVADLVESVLIETGHVEIARAFARRGEVRCRLREGLTVRDDDSRDADSSNTTDETHEADRVSAWNKRRMVESLVRRAGLDEFEAAAVVVEVEGQVIALDVDSVSTGLLRELVNAALGRCGSSFRLSASSREGIVASVLDEAIASARPRSPEELEDGIARSLLTEYSLGEMHSPLVREAHETGWIHVHGLGDPLRMRSVTWAVPEPLSSSAFSLLDGVLGDSVLKDGAPSAELWPEIRNEDRRAGSFLDLRELVERTDGLLRNISGELVLCDADRLLRDRALEALSEDAAIRRVLESLVRPPAASPRLALEVRVDGTSESWLEVLFDLARPGGGQVLPLRVVLDPTLIAAESARHALALVAELHGRGAPVRFGMARSRRAAAIPEVDPFEGRVDTCVGRVTLNLPQIAYRSGRRSSGGIEAELEATLDLAVKALLERRRFLASLGARRGLPLWDVLGRSLDAAGQGLLETELLGGEIGLLGLAECIKYLTGEEMHESPRAAERGRGLLGTLAGRLLRDSRTLGIPLRACETLCPDTLGRLETLDRERHTASVAEVDAGRRSTDAADGWIYSLGLRLHAGARVDHTRRLRHVAGLSEFATIDDLLADIPTMKQEPPRLLAALLGELARREPDVEKCASTSWSGWNSTSGRNVPPELLN